MRALIISLIVLLFVGGACSAQSFTGAYARKDGERTHTLKLKQEADGKVTGTYSDGEATLQVSGEVKSGTIIGKAKLEGFPVTFSLKVTRDAGNVVLELTEEEDGKPDPQATEKNVMTPI